MYRARVFVSLLTDTVGYDDDTVCELKGIYRQVANHTKVEVNDGLIIRPNPSSDFVEIIISNQTVGICTIEIRDITGRTVYSGVLDCKQKSKIVSVSSFNEGIYTVTVTLNDKFVKLAKLAILR